MKTRVCLSVLVFFPLLLAPATPGSADTFYEATFRNRIPDGEILAVKGMKYKILTWEVLNSGRKVMFDTCYPECGVFGSDGLGESKTRNVWNFGQPGRHRWRFRWRCAGKDDPWKLFTSDWENFKSWTRGGSENHVETFFTFRSCTDEPSANIRQHMSLADQEYN